MRYELTLLEKIINENLYLENQPALTGEALKTTLATEQSRIKASLRDIILSNKKEPAIERYIRYHYQVLLRLSGELHSHAADSNLPEPDTSLDNCVEELLRFMESHFQHYFSLRGEDKIITSLAIRELAVMCRLLMETGVFRVQNKTALAESIIRHVVTLQKEINEDLSRRNFYNGLFELDLKTIDSVRSILHRMMNRLDELRVKAVEKEKDERQGRRRKNSGE